MSGTPMRSASDSVSRPLITASRASFFASERSTWRIDGSIAACSGSSTIGESVPSKSKPSSIRRSGMERKRSSPNLFRGSGPEMAGRCQLGEFLLRYLQLVSHGCLHQRKDDLDPGQVDAVGGGQLPDQADPFDVPTGIAASLGGGSFRRYQILALVHEQCPGLDIEHVGHFAGLMRHSSPP